MPRKISTSPPMIMTPPPIRYPMVSPARWEPLPISAPNRIGPLAPKTWAMAKNTAMASARISTGKISLTEKELGKIRASVQAGRVKDADKIGVKVGKVINKRKVGKHFITDIADGRL